MTTRFFGPRAGSSTQPGVIKPRNYHHCTPHDVIYHVGCGGEVIRTDIGHYDNVQLVWDCDRCKRRWQDSTMKKFTTQELVDRFYLLEKDDGPALIIVEDTDGVKRFTRTVTQYEANQRGLKKIPDPTR